MADSGEKENQQPTEKNTSVDQSPLKAVAAWIDLHCDSNNTELSMSADASTMDTGTGSPGSSHPGSTTSSTLHRSPSLKDPAKIKEREDRVRQIREKQTEERQKKIEELKKAQREAQEFREKQQELRRKKIEEMKKRDEERRQAVEERRKKVLLEEQEKRMALLKKNVEREARIDSLRSKSRHGIFGFGSGTPRDICETLNASKRAQSSLNLSAHRMTPFEFSDSSDSERERMPRRAVSAWHLSQPASNSSKAVTSTSASEKRGSSPESTSPTKNKRLAGSTHLSVSTSALFRKKNELSLASSDSSSSRTMSPAPYVSHQRRRPHSTTRLEQRSTVECKYHVPQHRRPHSCTRLDQYGQPEWIPVIRRVAERKARPRSFAGTSAGVPPSPVRVRQSRSTERKARGDTSRSHQDLNKPLKPEIQRAMERLSQPRTPPKPTVEDKGETSTPPSHTKTEIKKTVERLAQPKTPSKPPSESSDHKEEEKHATPLKPEIKRSIDRLAQPKTPVKAEDKVNHSTPPPSKKTARDRASPAPRERASPAPAKEGVSPGPTAKRGKKDEENLKMKKKSIDSMVPPARKASPEEASPGSAAKTGSPVHVKRASKERTPQKGPMRAVKVHKTPVSILKKSSGDSPREPKPEEPKTIKFVDSVQGGASETALSPGAEKETQEEKPLEVEEKLIVKEEKPLPPPVPGAEVEITVSAASEEPEAQGIAVDKGAAEQLAEHLAQQLEDTTAPTQLEVTEEQAHPEVEEHPVVPTKKSEPVLPKQPEVEAPLPAEVKTKTPPQKESPPSTPEKKVKESNKPAQSPALQAKEKPLTEEEIYKAKLAEKRREAREKAEREAELERQRQEELRRQEEEKRRREEEEQKRFEEEELRMAAEAKRIEEERLRKAIEEADRRRKEEEERIEREQKEKEEAEARAREEAERLEKERLERIKREEAERLERKKRLEMIMRRVKTDNSDSSPSKSSNTTPASNNTPVKAEEPKPEQKQEESQPEVQQTTETSQPQKEQTQEEQVEPPVQKQELGSSEESTPTASPRPSSPALAVRPASPALAADGDKPKFKSPLLQNLLGRGKIGNRAQSPSKELLADREEAKEEQRGEAKEKVSQADEDKDVDTKESTEHDHKKDDIVSKPEPSTELASLGVMTLDFSTPLNPSEESTERGISESSPDKHTLQVSCDTKNGPLISVNDDAQEIISVNEQESGSSEQTGDVNGMNESNPFAQDLRQIVAESLLSSQQGASMSNGGGDADHHQPPPQQQSSDFEELIDLSSKTNNNIQQQNGSHPHDLPKGLGDPFIAFEEPSPKTPPSKQENIADLLS
ncbi:ensconsin isoform X2 [Lingula anatina]|uniref:Ensconsin isoform X2 n=1 Tax=Lingula anatina TaxID=7574 RepID=A0A1S3J6M9_LINAN|nr:ensconsin isoform X2 [Lingula anatina]|eukprot:XP_013405963.1 ensconsin isoform X2 [Lingula anatina]